MHHIPTLPRRVSQEVYSQLCAALPPPLEDTAESLDARDTLAMSAVAALDPIDIAEALFAVQVVLTEAQARDNLRLANMHRDDIKLMLRCQAQAVSMMRQMQQALQRLRQQQASRATEETKDAAPPEAPAKAANPPASPPRPAKPQRQPTEPEATPTERETFNMLMQRVTAETASPYRPAWDLNNAV